MFSPIELSILATTCSSVIVSTLAAPPHPPSGSHSHQQDHELPPLPESFGDVHPYPPLHSLSGVPSSPYDNLQYLHLYGSEHATFNQFAPLLQQNLPTPFPDHQYSRHSLISSEHNSHPPTILARPHQHLSTFDDNHGHAISEPTSKLLVDNLQRNHHSHERGADPYQLSKSHHIVGQSSTSTSQHSHHSHPPPPSSIQSKEGVFVSSTRRGRGKPKGEKLSDFDLRRPGWQRAFNDVEVRYIFSIFEDKFKGVFDDSTIRLHINDIMTVAEANSILNNNSSSIGTIAYKVARSIREDPTGPHTASQVDMLSQEAKVMEAMKSSWKNTSDKMIKYHLHQKASRRDIRRFKSGDGGELDFADGPPSAQKKRKLGSLGDSWKQNISYRNAAKVTMRLKEYFGHENTNLVNYHLRTKGTPQLAQELLSEDEEVFQTAAKRLMARSDAFWLPSIKRVEGEERGENTRAT